MKSSSSPGQRQGRKSPPHEKGKQKKPARTAVLTEKYTALSFLIFLLAFVLYANTIGFGYVLDDDVVFLKNKSVQAGTAGIKEILSNSFTYGFTGLNDRVQSYRPVVLIVYAIEKQMFGNDPQAGHFINVFLFALTCVLLFRFTTRLLTPLSLPVIKTGNWSLPVSFFVALLFAAHPVHTEAVANIKGRDEIINLLFLLASSHFLLKHVDGSEKKYFILSVVFFFLALLCKEIAVTFLAILPMMIFFFRTTPLKKIAIGMISFAGAFILYMLIRNNVLDGGAGEQKMLVVNNALAAATNGADRVATALLILGKYVQLLFFPHPLSWDYSFNQIPIVSFSNGQVMLTVAGLLAMAGFALYILFRKWKQPQGPMQPVALVSAFAILYFFLTMSVISNIFILIGATMGDRFLFTSSVAFCLAVPFWLERGGKMMLISGTAIILLLFSFKTIDRNRDWENNYALFLSGVEAAPNSSRAQSALGSSYREMAEREQDPVKRGNLYGQAIQQYQKAVDILPENTEALYNLGVCYYAIGDRASARNVYVKTLQYAPDQANAANNLGVLYFEEKNYEEARKCFEQSVKYMPSNSDAWGNLGAIEHNLGNLPKAIEHYQRSLSINPANQNVQGNLQKAQNALKQGKQ